MYRIFVVAIIITGPANVAHSAYHVIPLDDEVSLLQTKLSMEARSVKKAASGVKGLTEFRDAVVNRPTPPYLAATPNPVIEAMKIGTRTPELQTLSCTMLNSLLNEVPSMQEPLYIQGGHVQAIKAMNSFATNANVQIECSHLLSSMVQWNWVLARAVADATALDAMFAALQNFPDHEGVRSLTGDMGSFCDFDIQNKKHLLELGIVGQVYNSTDKHYTTNDVAQMYNLWSTLCGLPDAAYEMVETHGELARGVRAMKAHRSGTVRGEVLQVHLSCFMNTEDRKKQMFAAGIVPEIVSAMDDEISGAEGELDVIGKPRMLSNAMMMLKNLADLGQQYRSQIVYAGAPEQVLHALQDFVAHGDHSQHGFEEMQHDLRTEACDLLTHLMGSTQAEHEQLVQYPSMAQLPSVLQDPAFGAELPTRCSNLVKQWPH